MADQVTEAKAYQIDGISMKYENNFQGQPEMRKGSRSGMTAAGSVGTTRRNPLPPRHLEAIFVPPVMNKTPSPRSLSEGE